MPQYLLSVHSGHEEAAQAMTDEEMQASYEKVMALTEEMVATGALVYSGRLDEPSASTVVRMDGGKVLTTDGPFAEAREQLGGFYIIKAADHEEALGWAAKTVAAISQPIEVRPFFDQLEG